MLETFLLPKFLEGLKQQVFSDQISMHEWDLFSNKMHLQLPLSMKTHVVLSLRDFSLLPGSGWSTSLGVVAVGHSPKIRVPCWLALSWLC